MIAIPSAGRKLGLRVDMTLRRYAAGLHTFPTGCPQDWAGQWLQERGLPASVRRWDARSAIQAVASAIDRLAAAVETLQR